MNNEELLVLFNEIKETKMGNHNETITVAGITIPPTKMGKSTQNPNGSISMEMGNFNEVWDLEQKVKKPLDD